MDEEEIVMVHHIVMWKFKPEIKEEQKAELKQAMKETSHCFGREGAGAFNIRICGCST